MLLPKRDRLLIINQCVLQYAKDELSQPSYKAPLRHSAHEHRVTPMKPHQQLLGCVRQWISEMVKCF